MIRRAAFVIILTLGTYAGLYACLGYEFGLREYLSRQFWLPFAKSGIDFHRGPFRKVGIPYAGMNRAISQRPLDRLRRAYQPLSNPDGLDPRYPMTQFEELNMALADATLSSRDREEVNLIAAKIDLRRGESGNRESLNEAKRKLQTFLRTAKNRAFLSEARGWLARVHYLLGEYSAAGKIYLDELNRQDSNLTTETLLYSLRILYGNGRDERLFKQVEDFFDTPTHATFAVQVLTSPQPWVPPGETPPPRRPRETYERLRKLLDEHATLYTAGTGSDQLALLSMRLGLQMGDAPMVIRTANAIPLEGMLHNDPDFNWMLACANFVERNYQAAETPLLRVFNSKQSTLRQKRAAAYGLVGVYFKTRQPAEQLRFALWRSATDDDDLRDFQSETERTVVGGLAGRTVDFSFIPFDLSLQLDYQIPLDAIVEFLSRYPDARNIRMAKYALAVRLAREHNYARAADIYEQIHAYRRAARMRRIAGLYTRAHDANLVQDAHWTAQYAFADFLTQNGDRIYFNDTLWYGFQRDALQAQSDPRLTRAERDALIEGERKLRDAQEEHWQAYLLLDQIVTDAGKRPIAVKSARLALRNLRMINVERFGRAEEIRRADIRLSSFIQ